MVSCWPPSARSSSSVSFPLGKGEHMLGFAAIRKSGFPDDHLDRVRWRSLIGEFPELRRVESVTVSGRDIAVPDSAELVDESGQRVGLFVWEGGQIYVDGAPSILYLAKGIAEILDAEVYDDTGDEITEAPEED